ncbi:MAG TPA: MFS transporter [Gaiellaceae bacterium]|jgi:MFS family permease
MRNEAKNIGRLERWTRGEKLLLVVLGGVVFLDTLDLSLVQVALPAIGSDLHLPDGQLQWIVSAFVLGYGGFLLFGGRSADVLGRKRVLVWGLVALIGASILGAIATDGTLLIVARFVKGVTAAFTAPAALSILTTSFGEGHRRNRALGVYAAAAAAGFTFGLVAGGLLTQLSWRYTFAAVAPVALVLLLAALRVIRPDPIANDNGRRLDVAGALTITGTFLIFVWAIVEAPSAGWTSLRTLGAFGVSALLVALFVAIESTVEQPLVRLGILRSGLLIRANLGSLLLFGSATALNFITTLYLQDVLGWGPLKTGLIFMTSSLATAAVGPRAGALATRIGGAPILLSGAVATVVSNLVFLDIGISSNYTVIIASRLLTGVGFGLAYPTLNIQALAGVRDDEQGLASGLVGSSFQIGGAIVLALATATILAHTPTEATPAQSVHAFTAGVYVAVASACLLVAIAVACWRSERRHTTLHNAVQHHSPAPATETVADSLDVAA